MKKFSKYNKKAAFIILVFFVWFSMSSYFHHHETCHEEHECSICYVIHMFYEAPQKFVFVFAVLAAIFICINKYLFNKKHTDLKIFLRAPPTV